MNLDYYAIVALVIWWFISFAAYVVIGAVHFGTGYLWQSVKPLKWADMIAQESPIMGRIRVFNTYDIEDMYILGSIMCGMVLTIFHVFLSKYVNIWEVAETFHVLGYGVLLWICWLIAKSIRKG